MIEQAQLVHQIYADHGGKRGQPIEEMARKVMQFAQVPTGIGDPIELLALLRKHAENCPTCALRSKQTQSPPGTPGGG